MGRLKPRKPRVASGPPTLPLSPETLEYLDRHRAGVIPAFEAALQRYAPPEWKAYYHYVLAYLKDDAREHAQEAAGAAYIEARVSASLDARAAGAWARICSEIRAAGPRVTCAVSEEIDPPLRETACNLFAMLVEDLRMEPREESMTERTAQLLPRALDMLACRGLVIHILLDDHEEDALLAREWGPQHHMRYLAIDVQEGQPPRLGWLTRQQYAEIQMQIARHRAEESAPCTTET